MANKCHCGEKREDGNEPAAHDDGRAAVCPHCGARLPGGGGTDALLAKLSQLARFGLAGEDGPLLEPNYEGR